jgi:7,8-dihydropterin-6-yl-methyl-4-(beta-D-ribofuranosyl)aminobenzene 5'-phosphate synthase
MIRNLSITVLIDNVSNPTNPQLLAEHGLALWIEADNRRLLFDTGQSDKCIQNAEKLGIDICSADILVLSHGHYDHTGAVAEILRRNPVISIYCHPGIFVPRYSRQPDGKMKQIGIAKSALNALQGVLDKIHWITEPKFLFNDIGITGVVPRICATEDAGGDFYFDTEGKRKDVVIDDQSLWFNTTDGIVIVSGCCHSGLLNTIEHSFFASGCRKLRGVVGGLHLVNASVERLDETYLRLKALSPARVIACHCTGEKATKYLNENLPSIVSTGAVGIEVKFQGE